MFLISSRIIRQPQCRYRLSPTLTPYFAGSIAITSLLNTMTEKGGDVRPCAAPCHSSKLFDIFPSRIMFFPHIVIVFAIFHILLRSQFSTTFSAAHFSMLRRRPLVSPERNSDRHPWRPQQNVCSMFLSSIYGL